MHILRFFHKLEQDRTCAHGKNNLVDEAYLLFKHQQHYMFMAHVLHAYLCKKS